MQASSLYSNFGLDARPHIPPSGLNKEAAFGAVRQRHERKRTGLASAMTFYERPLFCAFRDQYLPYNVNSQYSKPWRELANLTHTVYSSSLLD